MLTISAEQMDLLTRNLFFARIERFIRANCRNEKLLSKLADEKALSAFWSPHWPRASKLSEHDSALLLVLLAICECESVGMVDASALADQIGEREVEIKKFIADRGYP